MEYAVIIYYVLVEGEQVVEVLRKRLLVWLINYLKPKWKLRMKNVILCR